MSFSMAKIALYLKKLVQPYGEIAGLEIRDSAVRIIQLRDGNIRRAAVSLEPGVIEDGKVKDRNRFLAALKKIRSQWSSPREKISAIAVIPAGTVYAQLFSIPFIAVANFNEAARLNLESVSPVEITSAYIDWQQVGIQDKDGKVDILGAFVQRPIIDDYIGTMKEAGFLPLAIEFPSLALARVIKEYGAGIDTAKSYLVMQVASDGVNFMILRNGNVYFDYFASWKSVQSEGKNAREISFNDFQAMILREMKKVVTFYESRWSGRAEALLLITESLAPEITEFVKSNFNLSVTEVRLRDWPDITPSWLVSFGGAVRAAIARAQDKFISVMPVGTERGYLQSEIMFFIKIWRNVIIATLSFLTILFIFADGFLVSTARQLDYQSASISGQPEGPVVITLQEKARVFNQLVDKVLFAKERSIPQSPLFIALNQLAGNKVAFSRIFVNNTQSSILVSGVTKDEAAAIDFKNALIQAGFQNVSLPLSNIISNADGTVSFTITFQRIPS